MLRSAGSRLRGNDGRERGNDGGVRGNVELFHPHPNPLPSRERGCCTRQVPACAGMTGECEGMTGGSAGLSSCFTLTLTLSHRGRGDVTPGTAPLGYRRLTAATSGMGVWRRWLRLVGCLAVCARRGLFALSTIKRGTPVVRSARLGQ